MGTEDDPSVGCADSSPFRGALLGEDGNLIRRCAPPSPEGEGSGTGRALTWEIVDGLRSVYRAIREDRGLAMSANAAYREKQLSYLRDAIEYLTDLIRSDDDGR